jgi:hypothetical protein
MAAANDAEPCASARGEATISPTIPTASVTTTDQMIQAVDPACSRLSRTNSSAVEIEKSKILKPDDRIRAAFDVDAVDKANVL